MAKKDRLYINIDYRDLIAIMQNKDLLGFNTLENKEIFNFVMALGMDSPKDVENRDGFVRVQYLKPIDEAIISTLLLGKANNDDEINDLADFDKAIDYAERAVENGFSILRDKIDAASGDRELLERKLLVEMDSLYLQNVENDL